MQKLDLQMIRDAVPEIYFVVEKDSHIETIKTYEQLQNWVSEILGEQLKDLWIEDSREASAATRFESPDDLLNEMNPADLIDFIQDNGWSFSRKVVKK